MIRAHSLTRTESSLFALRSGTDVNAFAGRVRVSAPAPLKSLIDAESNDDNADMNGDFLSVAVEVGFSQGYK